MVIFEGPEDKYEDLILVKFLATSFIEILSYNNLQLDIELFQGIHINMILYTV